MSFLFLSLSLPLANSLERRNPSCMLTLLPGLPRPPQEGALCLHPLERAPCAFVSDASPVSRALLVLCINQRISQGKREREKQKRHGDLSSDGAKVL